VRRHLERDISVTAVIRAGQRKMNVAFDHPGLQAYGKRNTGDSARRYDSENTANQSECL